MNSENQQILFFLMGIQRSGGSSILNAFKRKRKISILREKDNRFFDYFMLKPEIEIRPLLKKMKPITFIESKSETKKREVLDILDEFSSYSVKIIWNYRDPVKVYYSRLIKYPHKDWVSDEHQFSEMWNHRNTSILKALDKYRDKIAIVKLEDLVESESVFKQLCEFVGINGHNRFYPDKSNVEVNLSDSIITNIENQTSTVLAELDRNRRFLPR